MFWFFVEFVGNYLVAGYLAVRRGEGEWRFDGERVVVLGDFISNGVYDDPCFVGFKLATILLLTVHFLLKKLFVCWFYWYNLHVSFIDSFLVVVILVIV